MTLHQGNTSILTRKDAPNGTWSEYSYDALQRLTQLQNKKSNNDVISQYAWGFDDVNQRDVRKWEERTVGANPLQRVNYSYDNVDQLVGETATETSALTNVPYVNNSFAHDAMSNRTSSVATSLTVGGNTNTSSASKIYNALNQITAQTLTSATNGTTTSTRSDSYSYDLNGSTTATSNNQNSSATSYEYDGLERLTAVVQKDASGVNSSRSEFVYDGLGRKAISREYSWSGGAWVLIPNSEVRRVYDGMGVVQERDANNLPLVNYVRDGIHLRCLARRDDRPQRPQNLLRLRSDEAFASNAG